jgi:hypothetical protein
LLKRIATCLSIVVLVLAGLYFSLVFTLDWETISYKKAPGGKMVAYHLRSKSEAGDAPYGDHIILTYNYWPLGQYYGETAFAAYCTGGPNYRWLNNHLLQIECETEKVTKRIEVLNDVHIQYKDHRGTLHNHATGADGV